MTHLTNCIVEESNNYKNWVTRDEYINTGGNCYVLYIELISSNGYITFAADMDSYSLYNHSYDEYNKILDEGSIPKVIKTNYDYAVYTANDYFPVVMELDLEFNGCDYNLDVYNHISNRLLNTVFKN